MMNNNLAKNVVHIFHNAIFKTIYICLLSARVCNQVVGRSSLKYNKVYKS
jgi:hypothetical protein